MRFPKGRRFFPRRPLLRVEAPLIQAQLVETYLLTTLCFQTLVATKTSRIVRAACLDGKERGVVDFGSRRAHGPEAGVLAARASYIGGCKGTSNCYAGCLFEIPVVGTAAHSWTMAFPSEIQSFKAYHQVYPDSSIFLIDTYDTLEGAKNATEMGKDLKGVCIDSGDLFQKSLEVREILDQRGCSHAKIMASGDLNEYKIAQLVQAKAPIDLFGVGTEMVTSKDSPALSGVYKMVERIREGQTRYAAKFSEDKICSPGKKQILRFSDSSGRILKDRLVLTTERSSSSAAPLLIPVIKQGKRVAQLPSLREIQRHTQAQLKNLPGEYMDLERSEPFPVEYSESIIQLLEQIRSQTI